MEKVLIVFITNLFKLIYYIIDNVLMLIALPFILIVILIAKIFKLDIF